LGKKAKTKAKAKNKNKTKAEKGAQRIGLLRLTFLFSFDNRIPNRNLNRNLYGISSIL